MKFNTASLSPERPRFYSVAQVADMFGMSEMTVYRAIRDGEFPAVKIRGRLIVPAKVIDEMTNAVIAGQGIANSPNWMAPEVA